MSGQGLWPLLNLARAADEIAVGFLPGDQIQLPSSATATDPKASSSNNGTVSPDEGDEDAPFIELIREFDLSCGSATLKNVKLSETKQITREQCQLEPERGLSSHRYREEETEFEYLLFHSTTAKAFEDIAELPSPKSLWRWKKPAARKRSKQRITVIGIGRMAGFRCRVYQVYEGHRCETTFLFFNSPRASAVSKRTSTSRSRQDNQPIDYSRLAFTDLITAGVLEPNSYVIFMEHTGLLLKSGWVQTLTPLQDWQIFPTVGAWCSCVVEISFGLPALRAFELLVSPTEGWWNWVDFQSPAGAKASGAKIVENYYAQWNQECIQETPLDAAKRQRT